MHAWKPACVVARSGTVESSELGLSSQVNSESSDQFEAVSGMF